MPLAADETGGVPASSNVRGSQSPRVFSDCSLEFTLKAPDAHSVAVAGGDGLGKGPFPMTKSADGVWKVRTPSAVPGFHYYWFVLDGVSVNDPGSRTFVGYGKATSGIEVPERGVTFYDIKQVAHGSVREFWYFSKVTGAWRHALIYAPPDYDRNPTTRYPLLILQHGAGEDETGWTRQGRANFILDNLLAEGRARPMIVAMDLGYATRAGDRGVDVFAAGDRRRHYHDAFGAFEEVIVKDLLPALESSYRTLTDREHRAMAGLSMGGMQTLFVGLHHPDIFAYLGSFSGPFLPGLNMGGAPGKEAPHLDTKTDFEGAFADPAAFNRRWKLLWLGAGTEERQFFEGIKGAADRLKDAGVHVTFYPSPGTAHEWQTWRRDLHEFAPLLFR